MAKCPNYFTIQVANVVCHHHFIESLQLMFWKALICFIYKYCILNLRHCSMFMLFIETWLIIVFQK